MKRDSWFRCILQTLYRIILNWPGFMDSTERKNSRIRAKNTNSSTQHTFAHVGKKVYTLCSTSLQNFLSHLFFFNQFFTFFQLHDQAQEQCVAEQIQATFSTAWIFMPARPFIQLVSYSRLKKNKTPTIDREERVTIWLRIFLRPSPLLAFRCGQSMSSLSLALRAIRNHCRPTRQESIISSAQKLTYCYHTTMSQQPGNETRLAGVTEKKKDLKNKQTIQYRLIC